ncbi:hypothetical protein [[Clostridium] symbiosum]|uniref:hypothetical protein n=2 Tax=Clostridium symbiosum TaxID=1512 RepID=UPI001D08B1AB|nr:hypothetical protein [[Clostridium] symbiosum]MCB6350581.1 hypothetical protein [[Clostridium] symbiosum]
MELFAKSCCDRIEEGGLRDGVHVFRMKPASRGLAVDAYGLKLCRAVLEAYLQPEYLDEIEEATQAHSSWIININNMLYALRRMDKKSLMKVEPEAFGYKASSEDYDDIADIFRTTLRYRRFPLNLRPFAERLFFTCCLLAEYRGPVNILIPFAKGAWDMWENDGRHETGNGTYSNALWRFLASRGGASKVHRLQGDDLAKYIYLEVKAYRKDKWKEINHIKHKSCLEIENRYKEIKMVLDAIGRLTPQKLQQLYPVTKEYDGERWGCKDYFYTMDKLKQWPPDNPIGTAQEVACLLWDYENEDLEIMLLQWLNVVDDLKIYCNVNGPSDKFHDLLLKKGRKEA